MPEVQKILKNVAGTGRPESKNWKMKGETEEEQKEVKEPEKGKIRGMN